MGTCRYKSATALVHEVRDLRLVDDENSVPLAIKLIKSEASWTREIELRSTYNQASQDVVGIKAAATLLDRVPFTSKIPIEFCPGLVENVRLSAAAELLTAFPFALIMPLVSRARSPSHMAGLVLLPCVFSLLTPG